MLRTVNCGYMNKARIPAKGNAICWSKYANNRWTVRKRCSLVHLHIRQCFQFTWRIVTIINYIIKVVSHLVQFSSWYVSYFWTAWGCAGRRSGGRVRSPWAWRRRRRRTATPRGTARPRALPPPSTTSDTRRRPLKGKESALMKKHSNQQASAVVID